MTNFQLKYIINTGESSLSDSLWTTCSARSESLAVDREKWESQSTASNSLMRVIKKGLYLASCRCPMQKITKEETELLAIRL